MSNCKICGKEIPEYGEYCASCWETFVVEKRKEERKKRFIEWRNFRGFHGSPLAWVVLVLICLAIICSLLSFKSWGYYEYENRAGEIVHRDIPDHPMRWGIIYELQGIDLALALLLLGFFLPLSCHQSQGGKGFLKEFLAHLLLLFPLFVSAAVFELVILLDYSREMLSSYQIVSFGIGWYSQLLTSILCILAVFFWLLELIYSKVVTFKAERKKAEITGQLLP